MPHARHAIAFWPRATTQPSMASTDTASHAGQEMRVARDASVVFVVPGVEDGWRAGEVESVFVIRQLDVPLCGLLLWEPANEGDEVGFWWTDVELVRVSFRLRCITRNTGSVSHAGHVHEDQRCVPDEGNGSDELRATTMRFGIIRLHDRRVLIVENTVELSAVLAAVAWPRKIDEAGHRSSLFVPVRLESITGSPQHQTALKSMMGQADCSICEARTEMRLIGGLHTGTKRFEQYWRQGVIDDISVKPRPHFA